MNAHAVSATSILSDGLDMHAQTIAACLPALSESFSSLVELCEASVRNSGKIVFFGNGGSASDAQHLATELTIRFTVNRPAIASLALTTDTSALTACGNDLGFDLIFSRQVEALVREKDVVIGITTSGRSKNVIAGLKEAKKLGAATIGLTGQNPGDLPSCCDTVVCVPSTVTARIQEVHILVGHLLCEALEKRLGYV